MLNLREHLLNYFLKYPRDDSVTSFSINPSTQLIHAGVLIPIIDDQHELSILFTLRAATLKHHAGHVSFPGGRIETSDKNLLATALRETHEEIGLQAENITILGELPKILSSSNYLVTPFAGLVKPYTQLLLDPAEVATAFTVPFSYLLNLENYQKQFYKLSNGLKKEFYVVEFSNYKIWGMTAAILHNLCINLQKSISGNS